MAITEKIFNWLGLAPEPEDEYFGGTNPEVEAKSSVNLLRFPYPKAQEVVICEPQRFDEARAMVDHLRNKKQVILNFESTPPDICQNIIDFVSAASYALDGHCHQLSKKVFIFTPPAVKITEGQPTVLREEGRRWLGR